MDSESAFKGCLDVWFLIVECSSKPERATLRLTNQFLGLIAAKGLFDRVVVKLARLTHFKDIMSNHLHQVSEMTLVAEATSTKTSLKSVPMVLRSTIAMMPPLKSVNIINEIMYHPGQLHGTIKKKQKIIKKKEETSSMELKVLLMSTKVAFEDLGRCLDSLNVLGNGQQRFASSPHRIPVLGFHPSGSFIQLKRFRLDIYVIAKRNQRVANNNMLKWLPQTLAAMRNTLEELDLDFEVLKDRYGGPFNAQCSRHGSLLVSVWWHRLGLTGHWPSLKHLRLNNVMHVHGSVANFIATNCRTLRSLYLGTWHCCPTSQLLVLFPHRPFIGDLATYDKEMTDNGIEITFEGHFSKTQHLCKYSFSWVDFPQSHWYWKVTYRELLRDYFTFNMNLRDAYNCHAYTVDLICRTTESEQGGNEPSSVAEHEKNKAIAQKVKERVLSQRERSLQAIMPAEQ